MLPLIYNHFDLALMILSIDFGSAVAKVLVVGGSRFKVVEVPLGFKTRPRLTVPRALRHVIREAAPGKKPSAIYASGEIASVELKEILSQPPLDPVEALKKLELPIVDVGVNLTYLNGRASRLGSSAVETLDIARFLPRAVNFSEIENYFGNKEIYPQIVPTAPRDFEFEQAAARVRIRALGAGHSSGLPSYIIATGGVFMTSELGQVVLILLDALEPEGLLNVFLDRQQILLALATLAVFEKDKAQEILNQEPFTFLGTTFSVPQDVSLSIDVGLSEPQELEVALGKLALFPLEKGRVAKVRFETREKKGEFEVEGGQLGLLIDTRKRPLELPATESERIRRLKEWSEAICYHPLSKK